MKEEKYSIERYKIYSSTDSHKKSNYPRKVVPKNWSDYIFNDIVKFEGGSQPPRNEFISYPRENYVRLIQIRDYKSDDHLTYIPKDKARKFCDVDDVMIGRYGPPIFQILRGIKGAYNVALIKAIPDKHKLLKDYLYYYIQNETLYLLIDRLSRRTSGQTGIDIDALKQFPFPLPPKDEQLRIVHLIKIWDKAIELKEKLIEEKKTQKLGMMQKLLTGKVRLPGFDEDWAVSELSNVCDKVTRCIDKPKEPYYRLGLRSHAKGTFHEYVDNPNNNSMDKLYVVRKNDLVVNITFAWEHAIALAGSDDDGKLVSHRFPTYSFKENAEPRFYKHYVMQTKFKKMLDDISPGGAGRNRVMNQKSFLNLFVHVPPLGEQKAIAQVLDLIDKEIILQQSELDALKKQKKGLMQLLLTGIVRVNTETN